MTTQASKAARWRKMAMQGVIGAVVGAGGMIAVLALVEGQGGLDWAPSAIILLGVGFIYALMGLFVGIGTAAPRLLGQRLLNVGDAEELREELRGMLLSAGTMGVLGLVLILLAVARTPGFAAGLVPAGVAMGALVAASVGGAVASWAWRDRFDELNWQLGLEGCFWAFCLSWALLTLWAAADFLGFGIALTPIDVVTTLAAMMLLGSFVAIGKRGMMVR